MAISSIALNAVAPQPVSMVAAPVMDGGAIGLDAASLGETNSFQAVLAEAVDRVQNYQATSQASIAQFLDGADVDLHQVALNVQKAETTFELFAEVRNKVVQAYQEMMRLQV
jgi:flagellar hook-basal body complex protein FliE